MGGYEISLGLKSHKCFKVYILKNLFLHASNNNISRLLFVQHETWVTGFWKTHCSFLTLLWFRKSWEPLVQKDYVKRNYSFDFKPLLHL
jgi:hypothetical protein